MRANKLYHHVKIMYVKDVYNKITCVKCLPIY